LTISRQGVVKDEDGEGDKDEKARNDE